MLITCWSVKGGAGTTVVSAALALLLARSSPTGAAILDLAGDVPAALGHPDPAGPGVAEWLETPGPSTDALARFEVPVGPGLALVPRGQGILRPARAELLSGLLAADARPVVVDCGRLPVAGFDYGDSEADVDLRHDDAHVGLTLAAGASRSLLVLRSCFLGLRRAARLPVQPSAVVLLTESGRAISSADVEDVLGVPVVARVRVTPQVARAVDAGILAGRLPASLESDLRHAA